MPVFKKVPCGGWVGEQIERQATITSQDRSSQSQRLLPHLDICLAQNSGANRFEDSMMVPMSSSRRPVWVKAKPG